MIFDLWEKLWGIDRWPEADALVLLAPMLADDPRAGPGGSRPEIRIEWEDAAGASFRGKFAVPAGSPLFQLYEGNTVVIRYNPQKPSSFYSREHLRYRIRRLLLYIAMGVFCLALLVGLRWLRSHGLM
jgi:hypothetical protein